MTTTVTNDELVEPLRDALVAIEAMQAELDRLEGARAEPLAIIGLGCRFPGGDGPEAFWRLLEQGGDAVTDVPASRWDGDAMFDPDRGAPGKMVSRHGGFVDDIDRFDAAFFDISPREAAQMDPQQRLVLEMALDALEDAAIPPEQLAGSRTGVFIGACTMDYARLQFRERARIEATSTTGSSAAILANRLSYLLDLHGPSLAVDTACSSSLVAAHLAAKSLRVGEIDLAIVGGVNAVLAPDFGVSFSKLGMLSPEGRCRTFDAAASGYVRGEGCGAIILKRLSDAVAGGDPIWALLRGTAINQDGRTNGLTAPSDTAQERVIRQALEDARVRASDVTYVEAHGVGTLVGDAIELEALRAVYGRTAGGSPLWLGSVKPNIGHLEGAAGIAALIKTVLLARKQTIPKVVHFVSLNHHTTLDGTGFTIPKQTVRWPDAPAGRLAGVSAFGFGGTNAHAILAEAPAEALNEAPAEAHRSLGEPAAHVLPISAKTPRALIDLARRFRDFLATSDAPPLADVCYTAAVGRSHHAHRLAVVGRTREDLVRQLDAWIAGAPARLAPGAEPSVSNVADVSDLSGLSDFAHRYVAGDPIEWSRVIAAGARRVRIPTYAWQRERHWIDEASASRTSADAPRAAADAPRAAADAPRAAADAPRRSPVPTGHDHDPALARRASVRLTCNAPGYLDSVRLVETARPVAGPGQVVIAVRAAALNFRDVLKALGAYPGAAGAPAVLGDECAGQILAVGDGVTGLHVGQEVVALAPGSFGSFVVADARLVWPRPAQLTPTEAAALPVVFATAAYALDHVARIGRGERVLLHAAAGGVGLAALQIAHRRGAEVFATAGSDEKRRYLRSLGVAHVFDSRSLDFADDVLRATAGQGVDVVLNSLAGPALEKGLEILRPDGRFVEIGKRDIHDGMPLSLAHFKRRLAFSHVDLGAMLADRAPYVSSLVSNILDDVAAGIYRPLPTRVIPVADAAPAFLVMARAEHIGKLVLAWDAVDGLSAAAPASSEPPVDPSALDARPALDLRSIEDVLHEELAQLLRLEPQRFEGSTSLRELGLDSLMTLELRTRLQSRLGTNLSVARLTALPSVKKIAQYVSERMAGPPAPAGGSPPVEASSCSRAPAAPPAGLTALAELPPDRRLAELQSLLRGELAQMLQIDPASIDGGTSLRGLGLDSLMTLELRTRLKTQLGIDLSVVKLAGLPSVSRVAEYAVTKLGAE